MRMGKNSKYWQWQQCLFRDKHTHKKTLDYFINDKYFKDCIGNLIFYLLFVLFIDMKKL
jgi:hypothetical protein